MDGSLGHHTADRTQRSPADQKHTPVGDLLTTAHHNRSLRRNLEMEYDEPPPTSLSIPQSYLAAMRTLQQELERCQSDLVVARASVQKLTEENSQLKEQLIASEKDKLESEVRTNEILRDYNTLSEVLGQSRLESMVLKKEVEQLKRQKQNVLEKVTEQVCKQRAIGVLEEQQLNRRAESLRKENHLASANESSNSNFRTPYLKEAISTEIPAPRVSELPLVTLHPMEFGGMELHPHTSTMRRESAISKQPTPSLSSIYQNRYEPIGTQRTSQASSTLQSSYIQLVKQIMRNEKLLVQMCHQLQCYQKQLLQGDRTRTRTSKQQLLLKIDILRKDIALVRGQIAEGRRRQSLM